MKKNGLRISAVFAVILWVSMAAPGISARGDDTQKGDDLLIARSVMFLNANNDIKYFNLYAVIKWGEGPNALPSVANMYLIALPKQGIPPPHAFYSNNNVVTLQTAADPLNAKVQASANGFSATLGSMTAAGQPTIFYLVVTFDGEMTIGKDLQQPYYGPWKPNGEVSITIHDLKEAVAKKGSPTASPTAK